MIIIILIRIRIIPRNLFVWRSLIGLLFLSLFLIFFEIHKSRMWRSVMMYKFSIFEITDYLLLLLTWSEKFYFLTQTQKWASRVRKNIGDFFSEYFGDILYRVAIRFMRCRDNETAVVKSLIDNLFFDISVEVVSFKAIVIEILCKVAHFL